MGTIKDRKGKDLTETEEIKKTWQEYMEEPYNKGLNDIDNYNGVVTNLDTLQYEVKWALGSITMNKASGGGGIPAELLKVLKVILLTCCTQYASKLENSAVDTRLEKVSFHSNPKEGQCQRMFKLLHNCTHFTCWQGNTQNLSS